MTRSGPRLAHALLVELERIDDRSLPIAEIYRRLGRFAEQQGHTRPSYERVREILQVTRALKPHRGPSDLQLLLEASGGYRGAYDAYLQLHLPREDRR
ncbi:MAG: hypothetical protein ACXVYM_08765 [Gaiellaceae bacterium]